jgi:hypothetical protein
VSTFFYNRLYPHNTSFRPSGDPGPTGRPGRQGGSAGRRRHFDVERTSRHLLQVDRSHSLAVEGPPSDDGLLAATQAAAAAHVRNFLCHFLKLEWYLRSHPGSINMNILWAVFPCPPCWLGWGVPVATHRVNIVESVESDSKVPREASKPRVRRRRRPKAASVVWLSSWATTPTSTAPCSGPSR